MDVFGGHCPTCHGWSVESGSRWGQRAEQRLTLQLKSPRRPVAGAQDRDSDLLGYVTRPHPQPRPGQILLTFQPHVGLSLALQGPTLVVQVKLLLSVPPCFLPLVSAH